MVFLGGGLGSLARFGISRLITIKLSAAPPIATLISNISATILLGVFTLVLSHKLTLPEQIKALILVGFCGGFSTFSTFSYETFELYRTGNWFLAILNVLVSVVIGFSVLVIVSKTCYVK